MGWGCLARVGAPVGLGKCNSSSKRGVGAEGEARGRGEPRVQRLKVWDSGEPPCGSRGVGDRDRRRPPRPRRGRGRGLTCVVPRLPPARSLARDSLQSPRNLSALRVWQRCLEKGSEEAAHSCSSPSGSPTPHSRALPSPPPPSSDGARDRSPAGANLEQPPGPSGKKLGAVGTEGSIPFSVLEPRSCQGIWILGGRRKELAGFGESSSGAQREPAAVPGARIAARLEAESALGNCLQR